MHLTDLIDTDHIRFRLHEIIKAIGEDTLQLSRDELTLIEKVIRISRELYVDPLLIIAEAGSWLKRKRGRARKLSRLDFLRRLFGLIRKRGKEIQKTAVEKHKNTILANVETFLRAIYDGAIALETVTKYDEFEEWLTNNQFDAFTDLLLWRVICGPNRQLPEFISSKTEQIRRDYPFLFWYLDAFTEAERPNTTTRMTWLCLEVASERRKNNQISMEASQHNK